MGRPIGSKNKLKTAQKKLPEVVQSPQSEEMNGTYHASIKIFNKLYEANGSTALEAIANLKPEGLARGVNVLVLKKGDRTQEKILPRLATVRLFAPSIMMREVGLKNVAARFDL